MKYVFLFSAGNETGYGLPSGGQFALDIFRHDTSQSKKDFSTVLDDAVNGNSNYAGEWLPQDVAGKSIGSFGKSVY